MTRIKLFLQIVLYEIMTKFADLLFCEAPSKTFWKTSKAQLIKLLCKQNKFVFIIA